MQLAHESNKCVIAKRAEVPLTPIKRTGSTFISRGDVLHSPSEETLRPLCQIVSLGSALNTSSHFPLRARVHAWVVDLDDVLVEFITLSRYECCCAKTRRFPHNTFVLLLNFVGEKKTNSSASEELPALRRPVINKPASLQSLGRI